MKKLLIITYYWPPSGGAAVQRWLSFANRMAESGNEVHVLTVDEAYATFQLRDESLVAQADPAISVHTTKTREPFKVFTLFFGKKSMPKPAFSNESNPSFVKKVSRFIRGNFFIPDPRKGWKPYALKKAAALIREHNIGCVITAGPPHSTHFIGKALKEKSGVYWIADFHDLWTDVIYYDMLYHLPPVKKLDKRLERTILESADKILTIGELYKQKLLSKSAALTPEKIEVLRIGYDEKIFDAVNEEAEPAAFTATYTGTIADFYQPEVFIKAFKAVVDRFPEVRFRLVFAGILSSSIKGEIHKAGLGTILDDKGYLSHHESLQVLKAATVLLLVNPVTKDEAMVIPGKIYEYLAAAKPIINITLRNSETAALISECEAGETFERNEQPALEQYLAQLVKAWKEKGSLAINNKALVAEQFSRKAIAKHLLKLLPD